MCYITNSLRCCHCGHTRKSAVVVCCCHHGLTCTSAEFSLDSPAQVTGFSNGEEQAVAKDDLVPFSLEVRTEQLPTG